MQRRAEMNWCLASGDLASVQMKPTFIALLALCLCLAGCAKKEPVQPSASNTEAPKPEPTKAKAIAGGQAMGI